MTDNFEFRGYNSLENHTRQKTINLITDYGHADDSIEWVAREKIHGTNFSFWYNGDEVRPARRGDFLDFMKDQFYDFQQIAARYESNVKAVYEYLIAAGRIEDGDMVVIYGEYAGDMPSGKKIQTGIEYGPQDFYVFEVCINGTYLDDYNVEKMCVMFGFKLAPLLARGPFRDIMKIPVDLESVVMEVNEGKPVNIRVENKNIAEGYVARPARTNLYFGNGKRIILKCKNEKWSEKDNSGKAVQAKVIEMTEADQDKLNVLMTYVTENRLKNVLSKLPTPTTNQFGMIMGLLSKDALEDFTADTEINIRECDNVGLVTRALNKRCQDVVRPNWINICDGSW